MKIECLRQMLLVVGSCIFTFALTALYLLVKVLMYVCFSVCLINPKIYTKNDALLTNILLESYFTLFFFIL